MQNINIGKSGISVPFLGMGTWAIGGGAWWGDNDDALSVKAIQTAVEQGIQWIDTAPIYGLYHSEEVVGEAMKHIDRDKVVLSTKCGLEWRHETPILHKVVDGVQVYRDLSAKSIIEDVEDSLRRLHTDHLDVLYTHWQSPDFGVYPLEETMEAMMKLKEQGKIRAIGASNVTSDIIHCNDWQSALVPIYIRDEAVRDDFYKGIRTVITVHNIEYQGRYGSRTVEDLFGLDHGWFDGGTIEFGGDVNLLKGAIVTADAVTAVSPTYAQELKYAYFAHGLENVMSMNARKLHGVLNGIDMQRYDPSRDKNLAAAYSPDDLAGKKKDKAALQRVLGLQERPDTPILAMVTRLVSHKGLDLVCETLDAFMGKDVQFVVLGKGDAKYETFFEYAKQRYGGRMAVYLGYSEQLAMQIYAGADLFLMPSKSEPCGLSQMIAMRYGAVPIVRETGGLKDTVHAYEAWNGQGNGFTFANYNAGDMCHVICEAIDLYHDNKGAYAMLQQRGMTADFSWTRSAQEYRNIYESICR